MQNEETVVSHQEGCDTTAPKKKGGRPANPKNKNYFGAEEEKAFVDFVNSTDSWERERIFADKLYYPFTKMIESIIRRYKLSVPNEDFYDTFYDTMSFMFTKIANFDVTKNYKAYSYCGTICKNYLIFRRVQYSKKLVKEIPYETYYCDGSQDKRVDASPSVKEMELVEDIIKNVIKDIETKLNDTDSEVVLTENEIKVGFALLDMLTNWETMFTYLGSKKFNKLCVLQYLRDATDLCTKDISTALKTYKGFYLLTKSKVISDNVF